VFVEDKSRKYDFVDNDNTNWTTKSSLVDRQKLQQADESQLRLACKLLSDRIDRGEIAPENTTNKNTIEKKTTTTEESLRHYNTTDDSTEENARNRQSMPVISEMLRGLETKPGEPEITVIPPPQQQQHETTTRDQQKTTKLITQISNNDGDNAPQHIEEYDPLTSIATVADSVSLDHRKTGLMRRISFFAFGKRKTSSHGESALEHYHQHNKGAVAVQ
jgi:hypothetical protein